MNYELIAIAVLGIFAILSIFFYLQNQPDKLLLLIVVGLGFGGFNAYALGTVWTPVKIITLFSLAYLLFVNTSWIKIIDITKNGYTKTFILCLFLSAIVAYIFEPSGINFASSGSPRSLFLRPLVQTYTYIARFSILPLALVSFKSKQRIDTFFNTYIWTSAIVAAIAVYQLIIIKSGGSFAPILRAHGENSEIAGFNMAGLYLPRLYAFAGEPKQLAVFLLPAIFVVLSAMTLKVPVKKPRWAKAWILLLLTFVYIFTFSTAGMIAIVLGLLLLGTILFKIQPAAITKIGALSIAAFLLLNISFQVIFSQPNVHFSNVNTQIEQQSSFADIFYERSIGRLENELDERYETKGLKLMFQEKAMALPFGLGPGMYNFHIEGMFYGRGVNIINSGWVVLLLDTGFIGVGLMLYWLFNVIYRSLKVTFFWIKSGNWHSVYYLPSAIAGLLGAIFCNLGIGAFESIILFAGVTEAIKWQSRLEQHQQVETSCLLNNLQNS